MESGLSRRAWTGAMGLGLLLGAGCANRVVIRAEGRIDLVRGEPVAREAPLVATFYTRNPGGPPVGVEQTVRVGPDGKFEGRFTPASKLDEDMVVGVELKGRAVFVVEMDKNLPVAQCREEGDGRVCKVEFTVEETLSEDATSVVDAREGKGGAAPAALCAFVPGLKRAEGVPELRSVAQDETRQVIGLVEARVKDLLEKASAAPKMEAIRIYEGVVALPCLPVSLRSESEEALKRTREENELGRAREALAAKKIPEALEIVTALLSKSAKSIRGLLLRAEIWEAYGQERKAAEDLENAVKIAPKDFGARTAAGRFYVSKGDYGKAVDHFLAAAGAKADSVEAQAGYADALRGAGRLTEAAYAFEKAYGLDGTRTELAVDAGDLHRGLRNLDLALVDYGRAYEREPKSEGALLGMAATLEAMGKGVEAVARYEEGVTKGIFRADGLVTAGERLSAGGRPDTAKLAFERAIDQDPGNVEASLGLAAIYGAQGFYEPARKRLLGASQAYPKDARPYVAMGRVFAKEGKYREAASALDQALTRADEPATRRLLLAYRIRAVGGGGGQFAAQGMDTKEVEKVDRFVADPAVAAELRSRSGIPEEEFAQFSLFQKALLLGVVLKENRSWVDLMPKKVDERGTRSLEKKLITIAGRLVKVSK